MSAKTRLWVLATGILCALVVIYGIVAGLLPQFATAAQTRTEAESAKVLIETQNLQLTRLQVADRDATALAQDLAELELAIPTGPAWPEFLRELQTIQVATGAIVTEVTVQPSMQPLAEAASAQAPTENDPTAETGADTGVAATDAAAEAETVPSAATNLIQIPVSITVTGTSEQVANFLRQVQVGDRLFVVSDVDIDATEAPIKGIANGFIYVVP